MFDKIGINLSLMSETQDGILKELAQLALENGNTKDQEQLYQALVAREKEGTTGFGNNIAVPHAKSDAVIQTGVLVARSSNKVEWNSIDDQPVSTWVCLLTPAAGGEEHLQMLAKLSRKLMNNEFVEILKNGDEVTIIEQLKSILQ